MTQPRIISTFSTYNGTVLAFRDLLASRGVAIGGDSVAATTGLTEGYIQKLVGPSQARRIGWASLFAMCGAGGVRLALVEDEDALRRYARRIAVRNDAQVRVHAVRAGRGMGKLVSVKFLKEIAKKGGAARWGKLNPAARSKLARRLNAVRWERAKAVARGEQSKP